MKAKKHLGCIKFIPNWMPHNEYVSPSMVNGRRVIDVCYDKDDNVHSVKVKNFDRHPNFETAREMGLPTWLWSEEGQNTIEKSSSVYAVFGQLKLLDKALHKLM